MTGKDDAYRALRRSLARLRHGLSRPPCRCGGWPHDPASCPRSRRYLRSHP
jgi:hypothetical protein